MSDTTKDVIDTYLKPAREQMEQRMRIFVPQIWAEVLHRSIIQSLSHSEVVALCVQHERNQQVQRLKRRNTMARRRRRTAIKREKRGMV